MNVLEKKKKPHTHTHAKKTKTHFQKKRARSENEEYNHTHKKKRKTLSIVLLVHGNTINTPKSMKQKKNIIYCFTHPWEYNQHTKIDETKKKKGKHYLLFYSSMGIQSHTKTDETKKKGKHYLLFYSFA